MAERISSIVQYVLLGIGFLVFLMGMVGESYEAMIYVSYLFFGIAILGTVAASVLGAMSKPESVKGSLIGIGAMLVIIGISYALADGTVLDSYPDGTSETAVKWSDAGLYTLYILTVLTVVSMIYAGASKIFRG